MEFKHSIVRVALRRDSIIQVKTVILIGLIALSRKFVILDPDVGPPKSPHWPAPLGLGLTYWLLRERDDRIVRTARLPAAVRAANVESGYGHRFERPLPQTVQPACTLIGITRQRPYSAKGGYGSPRSKPTCLVIRTGGSCGADAEVVWRTCHPVG